MISGAGTVWNMGTMSVGLGGNGSLDILDGGVVNNNGDANSAGLVTVNGPSSQWNVSQNLGVGGTGEGGSDLLQIENGGLVTSGASTIGKLDDGAGIVTVWVFYTSVGNLELPPCRGRGEWRLDDRIRWCGHRSAGKDQVQWNCLGQWNRL